MSDHILNIWDNVLHNITGELLEDIDYTYEFEEDYEEEVPDFEEIVGSTSILNNSGRLNIQSLDDELCLLLFRFTKPQIRSIITSMQLEDRIIFRANTNQQFSWDTFDAFAIMLRRFMYPARLIDLQLLFGIYKCTICYIFNHMLELLYFEYSDGIKFARNHLSLFNFRRFREAIVTKGSPYTDVVGFIDGTLNAICRPIVMQESVYNGHEKEHGLKYQAIVTPDGITVSLCGPFAGAMHDQSLFNSTLIVEKLEEQLDCRENGGSYYAIYGDSAYRPSDCMSRPLRECESLSTEGAHLNFKCRKLESVLSGILVVLLVFLRS